MSLSMHYEWIIQVVKIVNTTYQEWFAVIQTIVINFV